MRRFLLPSALILLLWGAATQSQVTEPAADVVPAAVAEEPVASGVGIVMLIGPDGQPLPAGSYRQVFIPKDTSQAVQDTIIVVGGIVPGPPPPGPTPTPVVDARARIAASIASVTDANKKQTGTLLATICDSFAETAAPMNSAAEVVKGIKGILPTITAMPGAAAWSGFVTAMMSELEKATTVPQCVSVLNIAAEELRKIP